ncbi:hypothetical protein [Sphingomonas quercus]|uniref:Uncharacterized protein n=1 Tax=Sphingomonas quercus TaxID=2842451 RepID=A0ABS6BL82_9SPHN|nr:hypothetical protein [Sphingomonas quercus]MBU3078382.1 hypothetical protein [Sphingomonas quercus]
MGFGSPFFVLGIIAIVSLAGIARTLIRARHGYPLDDHHGHGRAAHRGGHQDDRAMALLANENDKLKGMICRLEERIAVLERIATDAPNRLSAEIERLR